MDISVIVLLIFLILLSVACYFDIKERNRVNKLYKEILNELEAEVEKLSATINNLTKDVKAMNSDKLLDFIKNFAHEEPCVIGKNQYTVNLIDEEYLDELEFDIQEMIAPDYWI